MGKIWQITACDAASSYGLATVFVGNPRAAVAARFLREHVIPNSCKGGFPVKRVLTERGSEFKGAFDEACRKLEIRHTGTKPRHAFTSGFVKRFHQAILHDHWRVEFRRRYFTEVPAARSFAPELPSLLQPRASAPRLSCAGANARSDRLGSPG